MEKGKLLGLDHSPSYVNWAGTIQSRAPSRDQGWISLLKVSYRVGEPADGQGKLSQWECVSYGADSERALTYQVPSSPPQSCLTTCQLGDFM